MFNKIRNIKLLSLIFISHAFAAFPLDQDYLGLLELKPGEIAYNLEEEGLSSTPCKAIFWDQRGPLKEISLEKLLLSLKEGGKVLIIVSLRDSFAAQIFEKLGSDYQFFSSKEWKEALREKGFDILYSGVKRSLVTLEGEEEVQRWVEEEMFLPSQELEQSFIQAVMQELEDGKISFPHSCQILLAEKK